MQTGKDENGEDGKSKLNRVEAELVVDLVRKFIRAGDVKLKDIGVITPYKAQVLRCFSFVYRNNAVTPGTEARGILTFTTSAFLSLWSFSMTPSKQPTNPVTGVWWPRSKFPFHP